MQVIGLDLNDIKGQESAKAGPGGSGRCRTKPVNFKQAETAVSFGCLKPVQLAAIPARKNYSPALNYFMSKNNVHDLFSIAEAAKLSGLRRPMLDYLCRTGIVVPSRSGQRGRGKRRFYSFGDILLLKALARLLKSGVSAKRLKESFRNLNRRYSRIGPLSRVAAYLVTDGERIYLKESEDTLHDLSEGRQFSFAFVLELGVLHKQLREEAEQLRKA